jgi:uncharacterized protein (DUF1800 family)
MAAQADIEHLLRRTEFVARPARIAALVGGTIDAAVDDILAAPGNPGSVTFTATSNWERGMELTYYWFDRMAFDSPRPLQEKISFFWHGLLCSEFGKVGAAELMREQIDTFRFDGLGNLRALVKKISTQVAMLRYLDNNQNRRTSPNQNFARELMELFLLGVGNYTEADVEAATAAWTGHTDDWETNAYIWNAGWHDATPKSFLGRTINANPLDVTNHAYETIDVILGNGIVPAGATNVANRGRQTRLVAAEFISRKMWTFFAGTSPPSSVIAAMRDNAIVNDFSIKPWLKVMLTSSEFYAVDVKQGLVRSPVDTMVALLAATGLRATDTVPIWLMEGMGQQPLFPPNVSGWKHNGYYVNASAMAQRAACAQSFGWRTMREYWEGDGLIHLAGGTISKTEIEFTYRTKPVELVDRILSLMQITLSATSRNALLTYSSNSQWWERQQLIFLALMAPEFHVA